MLKDTDVSTVMRQVRVAISRSRRRPAAGPVVVETDGPDRFGVSTMRPRAEVVVDMPSGSDRPGFGPVITAGKRVFRRMVRWYAKPIAVHQSLVNHGLLDIDERLGNAVTRTDATVGELELRLDDLERTLDRLVAAGQPAGGGTAAAHNQALDPEVQRLLAYSRFEDRHRGSQGLVRPLLAPYLEHFDGCDLVVDLGCGRGEFVDMLRERGITAYGIDSDASQVAVARETGRDVRLEDASEHLLGLTAGAIDGAFSSQVAEHLTTNELISTIDLVHRKLAPGGVFVMETPNPEALFIFATFFYVDLTHIKPIHPEALRWAFEAVGFEDVQVVRSQRVPDSARLTPVPAELRDQPGWDVMARNTETLNALIYGYQHYAVVARKPGLGVS